MRKGFFRFFCLLLYPWTRSSKWRETLKRFADSWLWQQRHCPIRTAPEKKILFFFLAKKFLSNFKIFAFCEWLEQLPSFLISFFSLGIGEGLISACQFLMSLRLHSSHKMTGRKTVFPQTAQNTTAAANPLKTVTRAEFKHSWVPLNPNMDDQNSQIVRSPMGITLLSHVLNCPLNWKTAWFKRTLLGITFWIRQEVPVIFWGNLFRIVRGFELCRFLALRWWKTIWDRLGPSLES